MIILILRVLGSFHWLGIKHQWPGTTGRAAHTVRSSRWKVLAHRYRVTRNARCLRGGARKSCTSSPWK